MWRLVLRAACSDNSNVSDSVLYTWLKHAHESGCDILNTSKVKTTFKKKIDVLVFFLFF